MHTHEYKLTSGDLKAVFLPGLGMLCASLQHRGEEVLRRIDDLQALAAKGSTAGIPLLYPWANRLAVPRYHAAGMEVTLDTSSPLLHRDEHGLLNHGVPWSLLSWNVVTAKPDRLVSRFDWNTQKLLGVFPFRHHLEMAALLSPRHLTIELTVLAEDPVPVSFGFHPYLGIPGLQREEWRVNLPAMRKIVLDENKIPTGEEQPFDAIDRLLGEMDLDAGFIVPGDRAAFSIAGAGRRITVELLENYAYTQIFAPKGRDFIALEPMTAPANALISKRGLGIVPAHGTFRASFRICVESGN